MLPPPASEIIFEASKRLGTSCHCRLSAQGAIAHRGSCQPSESMLRPGQPLNNQSPARFRETHFPAETHSNACHFHGLLPGCRCSELWPEWGEQGTALRLEPDLQRLRRFGTECPTQRSLYCFSLHRGRRLGIYRTKTRCRTDLSRQRCLRGKAIRRYRRAPSRCILRSGSLRLCSKQRLCDLAQQRG